MTWLFGRKKNYVFIQSSFSGEWRKSELYSEAPMMARGYGGEFFYLLPDGFVEGKPDIKWRREGEAP